MFLRQILGWGPVISMLKRSQVSPKGKGCKGPDDVGCRADNYGRNA